MYFPPLMKQLLYKMDFQMAHLQAEDSYAADVCFFQQNVRFSSFGFGI